MYLFELGPSWQKVLGEELQKPYIAQLAAFVANERSRFTIFPPDHLVFNAFIRTSYEKVKVIIVGQDPYHGYGQAHGLSFSVPLNVPPPPSLQNIFKELHTDLGLDIPSNGSLLSWAEQGVMLLNATLTVRQGEPMSHHGRGWEQFTDKVISVLCQRLDPVIFVLWGKSAQEKCRNVKEFNYSKHHVLTAPHPSPFSARQGFFGCRHFSKVNELLIQQKKEPIDWRVN